MDGKDVKAEEIEYDGDRDDEKYSIAPTHHKLNKVGVLGCASGATVPG